MDENTLNQGLAALAAAAEAGNPVARQKVLFEKAQNGSITSEENDELVKSLGGGGALANDVIAPIQTDSIQKSLDVSEYLREHHMGLEKSLSVLCDRIEKSESMDQGFRVALAQTLTAQGELIKGLSDQVAVLSGQPAGPVKSRGVVGQSAASATVEKSMGGNPASNKLAKSQVLDIMEEISEGNGGFSKSGENMAVAIAKYEGGTEITKSLAQEVMDFHRNRQSA